jgi:LytS/YehU family sensor histidine kinase
VHFSVTGNVGSKQIAPMIFIPFIENAFKHTNNKKLENAISINIAVMAQKIIFRCENKFDSKPSARPPDSGLGNELIEKRLNLIYADKHVLEVGKTDDLYRVNLTINYG